MSPNRLWPPSLWDAHRTAKGVHKSKPVAGYKHRTPDGVTNDCSDLRVY